MTRKKDELSTLFFANLERLLREANKDLLWLSRESGISMPTLKNYKQHISLPRIDMAIRIAYAFGISTDELLGMDEFIAEKDAEYERHKNAIRR